MAPHIVKQLSILCKINGEQYFVHSNAGSNRRHLFNVSIAEAKLSKI